MQLPAAREAGAMSYFLRDDLLHLLFLGQNFSVKIFYKDWIENWKGKNFSDYSNSRLFEINFFSFLRIQSQRYSTLRELILTGTNFGEWQHKSVLFCLILINSGQFQGLFRQVTKQFNPFCPEFCPFLTKGSNWHFYEFPFLGKNGLFGSKLNFFSLVKFFLCWQLAENILNKKVTDRFLDFVFWQKEVNDCLASFCQKKVHLLPFVRKYSLGNCQLLISSIFFWLRFTYKARISFF